MVDTLKVLGVVRSQVELVYLGFHSANEILIRSMKIWASMAAVNATMRRQAIVWPSIAACGLKEHRSKRARIVQSDMSGSTILISSPSSTLFRSLFGNVLGSRQALPNVGSQRCCCDVRSNFASSMNNKHLSSLARKNSQAIYIISPQSSPLFQTTVRSVVSTLIRSLLERHPNL